MVFGLLVTDSFYLQGIKFHEPVVQQPLVLRIIRVSFFSKLPFRNVSLSAVLEIIKANIYGTVTMCRTPYLC